MSNIPKDLSGEMITVTWTKSTIGCREHHRRTMQAIGLKWRGQTITKLMTPALKGMLDQVYYLIEVAPVKGTAQKA